MRAERCRNATVGVCLALLSACSAAQLTRPEGDGGWSPQRRQEELATRARLAGVDLGGAATVPPVLQTGPLDLDAALSLAAQRNRRIAEAARSLDIAAARVQETRGRLLPATTVSGRYTWYTDAQTTSISLPPGTLPAGTRPVVDIRDKDFGVANATLTLPLDFSGELRHALAAAQAGYRGEQARRWATTLEQQALVVRAYFDLLEAVRLRDVTQQTLALYRQQLTNAQHRFDAGRLTKNELLIVQVALRNAEQILTQRDLAIDRARWALNQTIGADVDAPTALVDVTRRPSVPETGDALRLAYEHNPLVRALLEEQQRLDETALALERSRLPRFSAGGAGDYSTSALVQPQQVGSAFTGFTWDLGSDTRREAQIAQARFATDQNRIALERQLRELEAAVRGAQRATAERLSALAAAETAVGQAEENLRIRQQQFDAGRATSDDVLDAEAVLSAQRATLATALYQAHVRRAELQQLIGLPITATLDDAGPSHASDQAHSP